MFILLKGRSKDEAFVVGQEIADAVTNMFPKPMKLRFEKVMHISCSLSNVICISSSEVCNHISKVARRV